MAIFYVSAQTGDDSDNGTTAALAKATLQAGLDLISAAGDIVYVAPGTYREQVNLSSAVNGGTGDHIKIIGDPDCEQFPGEKRGVIRVTFTDANDFLDNTNTTTNTNVIYLNKQWIEIHNFHVDGGGHHMVTATVGGTTQLNAFGIRAQYDGRANAYNCLTQCMGYGYYRVNTVNCINLGGQYGFYQGEKHTNSVSVGGYTGFYFSDVAVDCLAIGAGLGDFWNNDAVVGCAAIGGNTGFRGTSGDRIYDSMVLGAQVGFNGGTQGPNGMQVSGSYISGCQYLAFKGHLSNTAIGPGVSRIYTQTSFYPNSSGFTMGDNETRPGRSVLYSYNDLWRLSEIMKPRLLNDELRGKGDLDRASLRNDTGNTSYIPVPTITVDTDLVGHPRYMGEATASYHDEPAKTSNIDIGPWEYSSVDHTASFQTTPPGIEIKGEGVQSFEVPVPSGSALTVSVAAKWYSEHNTKTPGIVLKYKTGFPSGSTMISDTGQNYLTGSNLIVTSSYGAAAADTWETITITRDAEPKDQIYDLQLRAGNSGSTNYVVFSDLEIS